MYPALLPTIKADAHNSAARSRLNWRPHRFKWTLPFRRNTKSGFCACAITFQLTSTNRRRIKSQKSEVDQKLVPSEHVWPCVTEQQNVTSNSIILAPPSAVVQFTVYRPDGPQAKHRAHTNPLKSVSLRSSLREVPGQNRTVFIHLRINVDFCRIPSAFTESVLA